MAESSRRRFAIVVTVLGCACVLVLAIAPWIGSTKIDSTRVFAGLQPDAAIFFQARLPRVFLAALAGAALSMAGVLFQALLRDSLADPYTLGIASGASLGAVLAIVLGWREIGGLPAIWLAALAGAAGALFLVISLASSGRKISSFSLLLSGVTVNAMAVAMILLLQSLATFTQSFAISRWLMGQVDIVDGSSLFALLTIVGALLAFLLVTARQWNLMAAGEDWAAARGVSTSRLMWLGFLAGALLTGSITVITGPIGFVGLIVPHALRLRLGADHRLLFPAAFFGGAAFLAICDTAARSILPPADIPVGVVTSLLGGPFFLWLLRRRQKRYFL
ncbi:MAG: iron ABC transporter permease [Bryobacterales bacterium]|nr:iron ABC transporter permease [Bryobacterales bacterium]